MSTRSLVWFRRDLRAEDHAALHFALTRSAQVSCGFVFDTDILAPLPRADRRVEFIHGAVVELDAALRELQPGAGLIVRHGRAEEEIVRLAVQLGVEFVVASHDDEPASLARDAVRERLAAQGIGFHTVKDHVIFERSEVLTATGSPFSVFTPYKNAWLRKLAPFFVKAYPVQRHAQGLAPLPDDAGAIPSLAALGFEPTNLSTLRLPLGAQGAQQLLEDFLSRIDDYGSARDFPAVRGPSYLSVHLRFGTVSIRQLAAAAWRRTDSPGAAVWLSELVWRDFYHQILHHHPHVVERSFKPAYDAIRWEEGDEADDNFKAWCEGRTGYPLVDAAMLQIRQSGYMHNRLRMVVASFLVKDLGIDWRRGEAFFATHLNDFDLAANNGGWQWAASTGCDAQPYFRIFNPVSQSEKFDPQGQFIRRYLPQLAKLPDGLIHAPWQARPVDLEAAGVQLGRDYPRPIVRHEIARMQTLERYKVVKGHPAG
ncbi:deoxyribodipyrimidine photo-lyase [Paucibacter sp. R3-3]|uniref:Deoxyribodipyrimidine photo-lyase n=1 Tax=Roseateles agri TaxID=3098619 RepID=A0ABU5DIC3_9BURK|nr:deoxyribodipyrimidine photo-lyase [Paucibacter sp. R3-3]MDY0746050.1 deoxyribodipyrimidine photo-lyase [Paucibacter sp. R3-3]